MDFERSTVIIHCRLGVAAHVVGSSTPEQGLFEGRLGDGLVEGGVGKTDDIAVAGRVIVGKVRTRLIPKDAVGAIRLFNVPFRVKRKRLVVGSGSVHVLL